MDRFQSGSADRAVQGGPAFDSQPRFSPDASRIAFISDRSGSDNIWVMRADGSEPRPVSNERGVIMNSPAWSPDGRSIAVRRSENARSGELWLYPLDGAGEPRARRLTRVSELIDAQGPAFSQEGGHVYFSAPTDIGEGRRALRREQWQIHRVDVATGEIQRLTAHDGGAVRPLMSPAGGVMAYAGWRKAEPALLLSNLDGKNERVLLRGVERTLQDIFLSRMDLFPGYAFAPDAEHVFVAVGGRISRVSLRDGAQHEIRFRVRTEFHLPDRTSVRATINNQVECRMIRWPIVDQEKGRIVFEAAGRIWSSNISDEANAPRPLTDRDLHATQPSLSPDGRWVALIGSMAGDVGEHVYRTPAHGGGIQRLTSAPADYARPMWSPDGSRLVVLSGDPRSGGIGQRRITPRQIAWMASDGGPLHPIAQKRVSDAGARFGPRGDRVWYAVEGEFRSIGLDGTGERTHLTIPGARHFALAPDGRRVAVASGARVAIHSIDAEEEDNLSVPVTGFFPDWTKGGALTWTFAGDVHLREWRDTEKESPSSTDATKTFDATVIIRRPVQPQHEMLALTGARILPMTDDGVIEDGTILIRGGRIVEVGRLGDVEIPDGTTTLDLAGRTIIPGLIDVHQHALALSGADDTQSPPREFTPASVLLAFGVTTTRDPALLSNVRDVSMIEAINSGRIRGPRIFHTGERLRPEDYPIHNFATALEAVALQRALGATYIKEYLQPDRAARRLIAAAAAAHEIASTAEGAFDFKHSVAAIFDGYTGIEHSAGNLTVRDDFAQLLARSETFYVPTILTQIGAEHYFRRDDVMNDRVLRAFVPESALRTLVLRPRRGQGVEERETAFDVLTENAARLMHAGATVGIGAHDMPAPTGLGTHWEIWSFVRGGVSPMRALVSATRDGARILGVSEQIGTIEAGKLADLVVLRANPLEDIRNTTDIEHVVLDGVLYDGATLSPISVNPEPGPG
jgi:imidazolonepropionase-like amidohydrolase/Tol biopolymer transport system component